MRRLRIPAPRAFTAARHSGTWRLEAELADYDTDRARNDLEAIVAASPDGRDVEGILVRQAAGRLYSPGR